MRIVGGLWTGRDLTSPGGRVRPTAEEVRRHWMASLEPELSGARVLELFSGSGALGLEALSRGAASVDFVEWNPAALHALKANVTALRARERTRILARDAMAFARALDAASYDVALADPPYTSRLAVALVEVWMSVPFARILGVEHPATLALPPGGRAWRSGDTVVTTYRREGILPLVTPVVGTPGPAGRGLPPTRR